MHSHKEQKLCTYFPSQCEYNWAMKNGCCPCHLLSVYLCYTFYSSTF